jgi:hypothetical protein
MRSFVIYTLPLISNTEGAVTGTAKTRNIFGFLIKKCRYTFTAFTITWDINGKIT